MKLTLADYDDPKFNPGATEYKPISGVGDEFIENAILDPALFASRAGLGSDELSRELTRMGMVDSMRQQQFIVFSMGKRVGITQPFIDATTKALGFIDIDIPTMKIKSIETTVLETGIGIAAGALSAIPNIYTQIIAAVLNFGVSLAHWAIDLFGGDTTIARLVTPLLPTQGYSDETDTEVFNRDVLPYMRASADWTRFFMPRYKGELSGTTRVNGAGQRSIGWALGNGSIPRAIYEGGDSWRISQDDRPFIGSGGLGFIPGGQRIYGVLQTTAIMDQIGPHKSHPQVYNRNCAGIEQVTRADTGTFFPTTTQGVLSLWDCILQRGPSLYTIDPNALHSGRGDILSWYDYVNSIWEGAVELWRNATYEGGWGCSFWKAALMQLIQNYTVGFDNQIGMLSWAPSSNEKLSLDDQEQWESSNVYTKIIAPALNQLLEAQVYYLVNTTIAAYLPIYGGVDADPLNQANVMGAMREPYVANVFVAMRRKILDGPWKYDVRLSDVVDKKYRDQIRDAGGGTTGLGMPKFTSLPPAPDVPEPKGGSGLPLGIAPPAPSRRAAPYLIGGGAAIGATALGYYFWDDIARLLGAVRERLPYSIRRRLP